METTGAKALTVAMSAQGIQEATTDPATIDQALTGQVMTGRGHAHHKTGDILDPVTHQKTDQDKHVHLTQIAPTVTGPVTKAQIPSAPTVATNALGILDQAPQTGAHQAPDVHNQEVQEAHTLHGLGQNPRDVKMAR